MNETSNNMQDLKEEFQKYICFKFLLKLFKWNGLFTLNKCYHFSYYAPCSFKYKYNLSQFIFSLKYSIIQLSNNQLIYQCVYKKIFVLVFFFRQTLIYTFEEIVDKLITSAKKWYFFLSVAWCPLNMLKTGGHRGRDSRVVVFKTTCASCEFEPHSR